MKVLIASYAVALGVLAVIDALWLGVIARDFYKSQLGEMLREKPIWSVCRTFLSRARRRGCGLRRAAFAGGRYVAERPPLWGAFWFCVYGAYDFTTWQRCAGGHGRSASWIWRGEPWRLPSPRWLPSWS